MIQRTVEEIADMIQPHHFEGDLNAQVKGVAFDSRNLEKGNLFIPLVTEKSDGHQFIDNAIANGASATLWQKGIPNPPVTIPVFIVEDTLVAFQQLAKSYLTECAPKVIGITGSNGKTTTKDMAASVFSQVYKVHKTEGNFNNHIGLPYTILAMEEDTEVAILEMGMSGKGEISLLTKIAEPDVAIITNIGEAHLQDLGTREAIAEAKLEITEGLRENGLLIFPADESLLEKKVSSLFHIRKQTFGETETSDLSPTNVTIAKNGSTFMLQSHSNEVFQVPIPGKHNILNASAVILAALECKIPSSAIQAGLRSVALSKMRMEWINGKNGIKILNDAYNSSPTAAKAVIQMVESMEVNDEKWLVLGDMLELGSSEVFYHQEVGKAIHPHKISYLFTYGPLSQHIAEAAAKNFGAERVFSFMDKEELISALLKRMKGGEMILFKASRGMKLEEVIEAIK